MLGRKVWEQSGLMLLLLLLHYCGPLGSHKWLQLGSAELARIVFCRCAVKQSKASSAPLLEPATVAPLKKQATKNKLQLPLRSLETANCSQMVHSNQLSAWLALSLYLVSLSGCSSKWFCTTIEIFLKWTKISLQDWKLDTSCRLKIAYTVSDIALFVAH